MADVIAYVQQCGRYYYNYWLTISQVWTFMADVIAIVADGKATCDIIIIIG